MREKESSYETYQKNFPSNAFLEKYFGTEEVLLQEKYESYNRGLSEDYSHQEGADEIIQIAVQQGMLDRSNDPSQSEFPYTLNKQKFIETQDIYAELRDIFDTVLRETTMLIIRTNRWANKEEALQRWDVFRDGQLPAPLREMLENELEVRVSGKTAVRELCQEFVKHHRTGAFHQESWWQWCVRGDSVWVEVIPEALALWKKEQQKRREEAAKNFTRATIC